MALIHLDHLPQSIKVNLPLNIIIPDPGEMQEMPVKDRKVLYLLHGLSDDGSAWQRFSSIEIYAKRYGLVVVMPSFGRSFYLDQPNGQCYFTYLVDELPRYLEDVFGISPAREQTLIAGLSMGGYGTMKAALLHPERYFAAASFSGVLSLAIMDSPLDPSDQVEFEALFGAMTRLKGSAHDPMVWLQNAALRPELLPYLYVSCGLEDDLYPLSVMFREACKRLNIPLDYREAHGKHDWYFWDAEIQRFLANVLKPFEPLEK
jgi:S-formylglutathione hydrolase FrmB